MEPVAIDHIFVYGTLKRGHVNWPLLAPYARSVQPAWIRGCLYDCGPFPALVDGPDCIWGELVRIEVSDLHTVLRIVDRLEEYEESDPASSMYLRRAVTSVTDEGADCPAFAYFYNHSGTHCPSLENFLLLGAGEWPAGTSDRPAVAGLAAFEAHVRSFVAETRGTDRVVR